MKSAAEFELSQLEVASGRDFSAFRGFFAPLLKSFSLFVFMGYFFKSVQNPPFRVIFPPPISYRFIYCFFLGKRERERGSLSSEE